MSPAPDAPFVRFSRDSRGYEYVYLVHAPGGRGGRSRILYWFRTPPGVKVGRQPFDPTLQRTLEAKYPELDFDWKSILEAQAPPLPEIEHWRERRRAEKATKLARQAAAREDEPNEPASSDAAEGAVTEPETSIAEGDRKVTAAPPGSSTTGQGGEGQRRRRRRRRGGRGRREGAVAGAGSQSGDPAQSGSSEPERDTSRVPSDQNPEVASEFVESSESEPADPTS